MSIPANISTKAELEKLVAATHAQLGKIDVLVCNAAVNPFYGSMRDLPDEAFQKILGVNIMANHWLVNLVLPEMIERKDGSIIVHRVLHKGTLSDFLFRSKMPLAEDEALANSKHFWKLIDEGRNARRV